MRSPKEHINYNRFLGFLFIAVSITCYSQSPVILVKTEDSARYKIAPGVVISDDHFELDGKNGFIEFLSDFEIKKSFSVSFRIKPKAKGGVQTIIMKGEDCPDGHDNINGLAFLIRLTNEMTLAGTVYAGDGKIITQSISFDSDEKISPDFWQIIYVVFDYENKSWVVYKDGKKMAIRQSFRNSTAFNQITDSRSASWKIGANENYCNYIHKFEDRFAGAIQDIAVYNYKRSQDQIENEINQELNRNLSILFFIVIFIFVGLVVVVAVQHYKPNKIRIPQRWSIVGINVILLFFLFKSEVKTNDTALFGGDTWEYQSMAINFYHGLGIQKFGGLLTYDNYKFDHLNESLYSEFYQNPGVDNVYRTPGYPLILGLLYKIFGPHPLLIKYFQLFLLCVIGGTLPLLGLTLFKKKGYYIGLLSGVLLVYQLASATNEILTEIVFSFSIYLICWSWIIFWKRRNLWSSLVLGLSIGAALLIKGSIIFLPLLVGAYILYFYYKTKDAYTFKLASVSLVFAMLIILPWSIYASIKASQLVFLSTQTRNIILDGNNELTADGDWHPEWRNGNDKRAFLYNGKEFEKLGTIPAVILFYLKMPKLIIPNYKSKLNRAFSDLTFHMQLLCSLIFLFVHDHLKKFKHKRGLLAMCFVFSLGLCFTDQLSQYSYLFSTVVLIIVVLKLFKERSKSSTGIDILWMLYINFFILTIISYGNKRFVEVIDFIYILLALYYLLHSIEKILTKTST